MLLQGVGRTGELLTGLPTPTCPLVNHVWPRSWTSCETRPAPRSSYTRTKACIALLTRQRLPGLDERRPKPAEHGTQLLCTLWRVGLKAARCHVGEHPRDEAAQRSCHLHRPCSQVCTQAAGGIERWRSRTQVHTSAPQAPEAPHTHPRKSEMPDGRTGGPPPYEVGEQEGSASPVGRLPRALARRSGSYRTPMSASSCGSSGVRVLSSMASTLPGEKQVRHRVWARARRERRGAATAAPAAKLPCSGRHPQASQPGRLQPDSSAPECHISISSAPCLLADFSEEPRVGVSFAHF